MIEILNPDTLEPCKENEIGVAVYTTLWEKGFPLLRYWTGDLMHITYEKCACGSALPRIFYKGRLDDSFYLNGRYVFPEELENCLFSFGLYHDYLAILREDGTITVKIEKSLNFSVPSEIENSIKEIFGQKTNVEYYMPGELGYSGHGLRFLKER